MLSRKSHHQNLPAIPQVKLGICYVHLRKVEESAHCLAVLFQDPIEPDLCLDAADALLQCEQPEEVTYSTSAACTMNHTSHSEENKGIHK